MLNRCVTRRGPCLWTKHRNVHNCCTWLSLYLFQILCLSQESNWPPRTVCVCSYLLSWVRHYCKRQQHCRCQKFRLFNLRNVIYKNVKQHLCRQYSSVKPYTHRQKSRLMVQRFANFKENPTYDLFCITFIRRQLTNRIILTGLNRLNWVVKT